VIGPGRGRRPLRPHGCEGGLGDLRVGVQNGHQAVSLDDRGAADLGGSRAVGAHQRRAVRRRAQDSGVQQAGQAQVARVAGRPGHLLPGVEPPGRAAHDLELRDGAQRRLLVQRAQDGLATRQLAVAEPARRLAVDGDDTVLDDELVLGNAQPLRCERQQDGPGLRGRGAQHGSEHARGERAEGAHVPRAAVGIASTISIESRATPSSSAAIWACEVSTPCPISIFPEKTVTRPSSPTRR